MRKTVILFISAILVIGIYSCGDDNDPTMEELCSAALSDLGSSAANWATSPANHTEVNCNEFKANLLKVLNTCNTEDYWDLYGGEAGWEEFVDEIEAFDCSMFP